jgi:hypothetical protein
MIVYVCYDCVQFFAREMNEWGSSFPLAKECQRIATHPTLTAACMEALCSPSVEVDVATASLHVLTTCRDIRADSVKKLPIQGFDEMISKGVVCLLQRGPICDLPFEFLISCIKLFGGMVYSKELLASCSQEFTQVKAILQEATEVGSSKCHRDFNESSLSSPMIDASHHVINEVIGVASTASSLAFGKTELRDAFQQDKSMKKTCAFAGCNVSSNLKVCSRCGVVAYCTGNN